MAEWEDVTGNTISITKEIGTVVQGVYKETTSKPNRDDPAKLDYQYHFDVDGMPTAIYGFGQLNYLMKAISPGTLVRIEYLGKEDVKGYAQPIHQCKVQQAKAEFEDEKDEAPF